MEQTARKAVRAIVARLKSPLGDITTPEEFANGLRFPRGHGVLAQIPVQALMSSIELVQ
jgi:hypothetical protein